MNILLTLFLRRRVPVVARQTGSPSMSQVSLDWWHVYGGIRRACACSLPRARSFGRRFSPSSNGFPALIPCWGSVAQAMTRLMQGWQLVVVVPLGPMPIRRRGRMSSITWRRGVLILMDTKESGFIHAIANVQRDARSEATTAWPVARQRTLRNRC